MLCVPACRGGGIEVRNFLQFSAYDIAIPAVGVEAGGGGNCTGLDCGNYLKFLYGIER